MDIYKTKVKTRQGQDKCRTRDKAGGKAGNRARDKAGSKAGNRAGQGRMVYNWC